MVRDELRSTLLAMAGRGAERDPDELLRSANRAAQRRRRARRGMAGAAAVAAALAATATAVVPDSRETGVTAGPGTTVPRGPAEVVAGDVRVTFDPPGAPAGATVTVAATGFRPQGRVDVDLLFPAGSATPIGAGHVGDDGRLVAEAVLPNVVEHEHRLVPGRYDVRLSRDGTPAAGVTVPFEVVEPAVGVAYRFEQGFPCLDYLWFAGRLWLPTSSPPSADVLAGPDASRAWARGVLTLSAPDSATFAGETGVRVTYRAATPDELRSVDTETLTCRFDPDATVVTVRDRTLAASLVDVARAPDPATAPALRFAAGGVRLGLGGDLLVERTAEQLRDSARWWIDREGFRGRTGPFSALETLREPRPHQVSVGPHPHCASPPVPPPPEVAGLRRVSVQPTDGDSCLRWFSVDLYVDSSGVIQAVTLDLWDP